MLLSPVLFRKAADQGYAEAQYWLGTSYEQGEGVPQDYVLAHMWFNLSASNSTGKDQERGVKSRDEVASKMTRSQIAEAQRLDGCSVEREPMRTFVWQNGLCHSSRSGNH